MGYDDDGFDDDDEDLDGNESGPDADNANTLQLIHDVVAGCRGVRCNSDNL